MGGGHQNSLNKENKIRCLHKCSSAQVVNKVMYPKMINQALKLPEKERFSIADEGLATTFALLACVGRIKVGR